MPQFNATDAVFFGFRLFKRDPLLMLGFVALTTVVAVIGMQLIWTELVYFTAAVEGASAETDPELSAQAMISAYRVLFGSSDTWAFLIMSVVASTMVQAGALRVLVFDRRSGWFAGMQLAGDELRVLVVSVLFGLLVSIIGMVAFFVAIFAATVLAQLNPILGGLAYVVFGIGSVLATVLVGARLCAAAPATIGEGKLVLLGSWSLTKGRSWGLLGAFVILVFIMLAAAMVVFVISTVLAPQATAILQGSTPVNALDDAGAAFRSPGYIFVTFLNVVVNVTGAIAFAGVGAYAYRMLGGAVGYANAHPPQDMPSPPATPFS